MDSYLQTLEAWVGYNETAGSKLGGENYICLLSLLTLELVQEFLFFYIQHYSLSYFILCHIFYHISYMAKLINDEKYYLRGRQMGTHFRCNKKDANPSKLQQKKMGVSLALYPRKYATNDIIEVPHTTTVSMV